MRQRLWRDVLVEWLRPSFVVPALIVASIAVTFSGAQQVRPGLGPVFAVPIQSSDGTVSLPGITFSADTDTGLYRIGANNMGVTVNGARQADWSTTRFDVVQALQLNGRSRLESSADKLLQINDSASATGHEFNGGTPTLGTCTGGSLTSGSHNTAGEVTGNTSGTCAINFGTPNFTNTPFCFAEDETTLGVSRISARSASSITISGITSGDSVEWFCIGRIGT